MEKCKIRIISQSPSGQVFQCLSCKKMHVEFNNLYFSFSDEQFHDFKQYFLEFDIEYWENQCINPVCRRSIMIPLGQDFFHALFHPGEIRELKRLLSGTEGVGARHDLEVCSELLVRVSMN
ncbi:MAG: hypothetical protein KAR19_02480 [Bacteroidales bacterium]|nr:hypothetical protein [Bacteroidales bacterium]